MNQKAVSFVVWYVCNSLPR